MGAQVRRAKAMAMAMAMSLTQLLCWGQAKPTAAQVEWQQMEMNMFCHFGPNTFTGNEWGDGQEDATVFNPTQLDCRQWVRTAKAAGFKGIIITAKHHDGFCLWPSQQSTHTVRESGFGRDVLAELSQACREEGLKFGVYVSPWDRNHPTYGTPEYNQVFVNTMQEVHTQYGDVFEQWFDGACGEGPNGKKQVYDWDAFRSAVLEQHPRCVIFSDYGPGCRWVGNEEGRAGETCWSPINYTQAQFDGTEKASQEMLNTGHRGGQYWIPAETDVSIRPGWFWRPSEHPKSLQELLRIYYTSVGRNSLLLLNVPPDNRGLIDREDSIRLMEFRAALNSIFSNDLAQHVVSMKSKGGLATYTMDEPVRFNRVLLQEDIADGQHVAGFELGVMVAGEHRIIATGTTIGYKRILLVPQQEQVEAVTLRITDSEGRPTISRIALYQDDIYDAER